MTLVDFLKDEYTDFDLVDCGSGSRLCRAVSHRAAQSLAEELRAFGLQKNAVVVLVGFNTVGPSRPRRVSPSFAVSQSVIERDHRLCDQVELVLAVLGVWLFEGVLCPQAPGKPEVVSGSEAVAAECTS